MPCSLTPSADCSLHQLQWMLMNTISLLQHFMWLCSRFWKHWRSARGDTGQRTILSQPERAALAATCRSTTWECRRHRRRRPNATRATSSWTPTRSSHTWMRCSSCSMTCATVSRWARCSPHCVRSCNIRCFASPTACATITRARFIIELYFGLQIMRCDGLLI